MYGGKKETFFFVGDITQIQLRSSKVYPVYKFIYFG